MELNWLTILSIIIAILLIIFVILAIVTFVIFLKQQDDKKKKKKKEHKHIHHHGCTNDSMCFESLCDEKLGCCARCNQITKQCESGSLTQRGCTYKSEEEQIKLQKANEILCTNCSQQFTSTPKDPNSLIQPFENAYENQVQRTPTISQFTYGQENNPIPTKTSSAPATTTTTDPTTATDPTTKPTDPPVEPTDTPVEPTDPPVEPIDPPVEPTDPPNKPIEPPTDPTDDNTNSWHHRLQNHNYLNNRIPCLYTKDNDLFFYEPQPFFGDEWCKQSLCKQHLKGHNDCCAQCMKDGYCKEGTVDKSNGDPYTNCDTSKQTHNNNNHDTSTCDESKCSEQLCTSENRSQTITFPKQNLLNRFFYNSEHRTPGCCGICDDITNECAQGYMTANGCTINS